MMFARRKRITEPMPVSSRFIVVMAIVIWLGMSTGAGPILVAVAIGALIWSVR